MQSNFILLNTMKKTINYINIQLKDFPKKEMVLNQCIQKNMYETVELIFNYSSSTSNNNKVKILRSILVKISMLDFYITDSFEKQLINKSRYKSIGLLITELRKIVYGLIKSDEN